jgi:hypothetical protein
MGWTGYTIHLTESRDEDSPCLVIHIDPISTIVEEAMRTASRLWQC